MSQAYWDGKDLKLANQYGQLYLKWKGSFYKLRRKKEEFFCDKKSVDFLFPGIDDGQLVFQDREGTYSVLTLPEKFGRLAIVPSNSKQLKDK